MKIAKKSIKLSYKSICLKNIKALKTILESRFLGLFLIFQNGGENMEENEEIVLQPATERELTNGKGDDE